MDLHQIGSFKRGLWLTAENAQDALWSEIERLGTSEVTGRLTSDKPDIDWQEHRRYAQVRIVQALEFRRAAASMTLFTRPLLLYYAFLNLVRAFLAVYPEVMGRQRHGLVYRRGDTLMESAAEATSGTFTEYVQERGVEIPKGFRLTLTDSLAWIPELATDFRATTRECGVVPVQIEALYSGKVSISFDVRFMTEELFRRDWQEAFPGLAEEFTLAAAGSVLEMKEPLPQSDYGAVCQMCERHFLPNLAPGEEPSWFAVRAPVLGSVLPRDAYYLVALFILSNIVRYEPEQLEEASRFASETGWLIRRFLAVTERYFPQLLLSWSNRANVYVRVG